MRFIFLQHVQKNIYKLTPFSDKFYLKFTFKCRKGKPLFILIDKVCNGIHDCNDESDELFCHDSKCPDYCSCYNSSYIFCQRNITTLSLQDYPSMKIGIFENILVIDAIHTGKISFNHAIAVVIKNTTEKNIISILKIFNNIVFLNISNNSMTLFNSSYLKNSRLIQNIDCSLNEIEILSENTFENMFNLFHLNLSDNPIKIIPKISFSHLISLRTLNLKNSKNIFIHELTFEKLQNLTILNIQFYSKNHLNGNIFKNLKSLKIIYAKYYKICCLFHKNINCYYQKKFFSICFQSISMNNIKKISISLLTIFCLLNVGQLILIIIYFFKKFNKLKIKFYFFLDILTTIYLFFQCLQLTLKENQPFYCLISRTIFLFLLISKYSNSFFQQLKKYYHSSKYLSKPYLLTCLFSFGFIFTYFVYHFFVMKKKSFNYKKICFYPFFHVNNFYDENFKYFYIIFIIFLLFLTNLTILFFIKIYILKGTIFLKKNLILLKKNIFDSFFLIIIIIFGLF